MKKQIVLAVLVMMGFSSMAFGDEIDNRFRQARKYLNDNKMTITTTVDQAFTQDAILVVGCLLYTSPSPRDRTRSRMPSSA